MRTTETDDACGERSEAALPLELSRVRHFGDEWQHICQTLLSCERLLTVMSTERPTIDRDDRVDDTDDTHDRQQLRRIIRSIEPKKYSKAAQRRQTSQTLATRRSSYHRLKALTQLLMSSNLKRSTSLQSVPAVHSDDTDDTTATLPRLRRRPRINRFYHSLDVSDDLEPEAKTDDRSGLSLELSSPTCQLLPPSRAQKQLNRHSCDVTSLLLSPSSHTSSQSRDTQSGRQILKYSKKRLRGPYGEMLESMMNTKNSSQEDDVKQNLSFIQELLRETEKQRKALDSSAKETTGTADVTTATTEDDKTSITATIGRHLDARTHIVGELYDTEKSFCEQLRDLTDKYAKPLQDMLIVDSLFVQVIFGKVPELLQIHSKFLEELRRRITNWSRESTVGDLFARFDDQQCADAYLAFVDNWFASKTLVKQLAREKPAFQRFLAEQSREHRSKLSLDELMIAIVQRIPRFELLLKQLLKNTTHEHPDHVLLEDALTKIHALALCVNRAKNDAHDTSSLSSSSTVGQQIDVRTTDRVSSQQLRDICDGLPPEALQTDLQLVMAITIRKRERVLLLFGQHLVILAVKGKKKSDKFEENKYKALNHFLLEQLELNSQTFDILNSENCFQVLEKDLNVLDSIQSSFLTRLSQHSRHVLESVVQELALSITKRMSELRERERNLELIVSDPQDSQSRDSSWTTATTTTTTSISLSFASSDKRKQFEQTFRELKQRKSHNSRLLPEFLCALPIRKTRAGLQFTCASPTDGTRDVWICNSDGFVGQISVLSLNWTSETTLEPTIVSSNGVCNSRIICMTCVPKAKQNTCHALSSDESSVSDSEGDTQSDATTGERQTRRVSSKRSSLSSPTMWFGTDDSSVHIYSCFDAIRIKKNKVKVALSAKVEAITHFSERVFVSLANHSVAIFDRNPTSGAWNTVPEVRESLNCLRMCSVRQRYLWTSGHSGSAITVRDHDLRPLFAELVVCDDANDTLSHMTSVDDSCRVFVVAQSSLSLHVLSSEEPFARIQTISLQPALQRALISCEDIIRQHKSACLKISSLLQVKSQLWIGTSAGVILVLDGSSSELEIVPNGHTGHVRFLTCIRSERSLVVISGGDGLEQYSSAATLASRKMSSRTKAVEDGGESGREDSTNHLILFQIN